MSQLRLGFYFSSAFLGMVIQNIIPQIFFLAEFNTSAGKWIAWCLTLGSIANFLGHSSARNWGFDRFSNVMLRAGWLRMAPALLTGISLVIMAVGKHPVTFLTAFSVVTFVNAYVFNIVDNEWLKSLPLAKLKSHVTNAILFQSLGNIAGPLLYSIVSGTLTTLVVSILFSIITGFALWSIGKQGFSATMTNRKMSHSPIPEQTALDVNDWLFLLYVLLMFASVILLTANLMILLREFYNLTDPTKSVGLILAVSNFAGIAAVMGYYMWPKIGPMIFRTTKQQKSNVSSSEQNRKIFPAKAHVALLLTMLLAGVLFNLRLAHSLVYFLLIGSMVGVFYGFFRLFSKEYASRRVAIFEKTKLLSWYNNLHSASSILVFVFVIVETSVQKSMNFALGSILADGIIACVLLAGVVLAVFSWRLIKERQILPQTTTASIQTAAAIAKLPSRESKQDPESSASRRKG